MSRYSIRVLDSMARYRRLIFAAILLPAVVVPLWFAVRAPDANRQGASRAVESQGYDNPSSRRAWEYKRLRDPATGRIPDGIHRAELAYAASLRTTEGLLFKGADLGLEWEPRGPHNIGGRTRALALDMQGEDTILAGGVTGGMWRSTDGGATWRRTTTTSQLPGVTCITQDPRPGKRHIWYYGTGEILGSSASGGGAYYGGNGIYRSTDNGLTWDSLPSTASNRPHVFDSFFDYVWRVAVDPSNSAQDEIYAATYGGIYRSTNGGFNWNQVLFDNLSRYSANCDLAISDSGVVYATLSSDGGRKGIYRSTNGTKWTNITPPNWPANYRRTVIGISPSNPNVVYFLAETPGSGKPGRNFKGDTAWSSLWKYTYVSGEGSGAGGTWEDRSANLPAFGGSFGDYNPQFSYNMHIEVKPDNENVLFIGGTNLYRSTDAFATPGNSAWIGGYRDVTLDSAVRLQLEYPNHHPDQHFLLFSRANPNIAFTASDGGVHKSLDIMAPSVEWIDLNNGYITSQFYTIAIDHASPGDDLIVGGLQDNGTWLTTTSNESTPWNWIGSGDGAWCAVADGRSSIYVSKQEGKAYRVLLDESGNTREFTRIDPAGGGNYLFINPFALDPSNTSSMFLLGGSVIWRNSDLTQIPMGSTSRASTNWTRLENTRVPDSVRLTAVSLSKASPAHRLYYGTDDGRVYRIDGADAGDPAAVDITGADFPKSGYVNCVAVDPENGDRAVVVFSNYSVQSLFLTTDAGATWSPIGGNLEQSANGSGAGPSCRWFSFLHRGGGWLYLIGTSTGLYSTTNLDSMRTFWTLEGAETIGNTVVDMIEVRPSDGFVAIATHGSGIFSTTVAPLSVDEPITTGGSRIALDASYPNPATSEAFISFTIPSSPGGALPVELKLFDATGREVLTLLDRALPAGRYTERLDLLGYPGITLPNGTYYYRLRAGTSMATRGMQVVR